MQEVGKYQLIRKLASGGMAEVFLAKAAGPMGFEKTLVLKRILPHLAEEPAFVEMFLSEAKLAARLTHPNIVQIFDFGQADGAYFLAMEYIDGPSLRMLIKRASAQGLLLPLAACARIVAHACEGLAFAHDCTEPETGAPLELIHRDVSPDNILLSRQGAVKVVDFGIAKAAGQGHKTLSGVIKGKLAYMPPEQVRAESLDRRVDVYALGVVLYELLTGHKPFEANSDVGLMRAILTQSPMPAVQFRPELPDSLRRILGRALCKDREQRYPDCHALQADLEEFILLVGKPVTTQQLAQLITQVASSTDSPTPRPQPAPLPGGPAPSDSLVHAPSSAEVKTDVEPDRQPETVELRGPEALREETREPRTEPPTVPDIRPPRRATAPAGPMVARAQRKPVKPRPGVSWVLVAGVLLVAGGGVVLWRRASSGSESWEPMRMPQREPLPVTSPSAEPPPSPSPELSTNSPGAQLQEQATGESAAVLQDTPAAPEDSPSAPTSPAPEVSSLQPGRRKPVSPKPTPQEPDASKSEPASPGGVPAKLKRTSKNKTGPESPPRFEADPGSSEMAQKSEKPAAVQPLEEPDCGTKPSSVEPRNSKDYQLWRLASSKHALCLSGRFQGGVTERWTDLKTRMEDAATAEERGRISQKIDQFFNDVIYETPQWKMEQLKAELREAERAQRKSRGAVDVNLDASTCQPDVSSDCERLLQRLRNLREAFLQTKPSSKLPPLRELRLIEQEILAARTNEELTEAAQSLDSWQQRHLPR